MTLLNATTGGLSFDELKDVGLPLGGDMDFKWRTIYPVRI
jgi:hypothetical protein